MSNEIEIPRWVLDEVVDVCEGPANSYSISRVSSQFPATIVLSFSDGGQMLFNGQFVNAGNNFIDYISMIDEYHEQGGEVDKTVRQAPFRDPID